MSYLHLLTHFLTSYYHCISAVAFISIKMVHHNNMSRVSCLLFSGEVGGAGYGLPCAWWADDSHPGAASLWFPPGSASGRVEPRLLVSRRALRDGDGASWCQGLCLFPHHNGAKSLPHWTVLLHDVCGWENVQTGELWKVLYESLSRSLCPSTRAVK